MKKFLLISALFIGGSFACNAQSDMNVTLDQNVCIRAITVQYSTSTSAETFDLGCSDDYELGLADLSTKISAVVINGYVCGVGVTNIRLSNGAAAQVQTGLHDEAKGPFSNIVVR